MNDYQLLAILRLKWAGEPLSKATEAILAAFPERVNELTIKHKGHIDICFRCGARFYTSDGHVECDAPKFDRYQNASADIMVTRAEVEASKPGDVLRYALRRYVQVFRNIFKS